MYTKEISGERQMEFLSKFDFIREAGSEGEVKAAELIRDFLDGFGAKSRMEEFPFYGFRMKRAVLKVVEPYQKEYVVTGYGRCGNTSGEGLRAPFLYVENGDDISLSCAGGKIVMVNGRVSGELYQRLVDAGVVGFVSVEGSPLDEGVDRVPCQRSLPIILPGEAAEVIEGLSGNSSKENQSSFLDITEATEGLSEPAEDIQKVEEIYSSRITGVGLHYKDAVELVTRGASEVCLSVEQEVTVCRSRNVVVRIEGTDKKEEILTLTAHYDSVPEGPGAYDNMAGAAIIMELCRYFQEHRPRRTTEFIWFGAEEKGLLGSRNYVKVHADELGVHRFNMNVDLAGQLVGGNVLGVTGEAYICDKLLAIAARAGIGASTKNQIWGSDSNSFAWKGIPAMTLNRDGFGMHTRHDTINLLSAWSLERSAVLLGCIADELGNVEEFPFERTMPEKFLEELDAYMRR